MPITNWNWLSVARDNHNNSSHLATFNTFSPQQNSETASSIHSTQRAVFPMITFSTLQRISSFFFFFLHWQKQEGHCRKTLIKNKVPCAGLCSSLAQRSDGSAESEKDLAANVAHCSSYRLKTYVLGALTPDIMQILNTYQPASSLPESLLRF